MSTQGTPETATADAGAGATTGAGATVSRRQWLWDHIGRISGLLLGLCAFAFICMLAALGWPPAYALVVVIVMGVVMIAVGGRIRGR